MKYKILTIDIPNDFEKFIVARNIVTGEEFELFDDSGSDELSFHFRVGEIYSIKIMPLYSLESDIEKEEWLNQHTQEFIDFKIVGIDKINDVQFSLINVENNIYHVRFQEQNLDSHKISCYRYDIIQVDGKVHPDFLK